MRKSIAYSILSFLLLSATHTVIGYDVVLKNGKTIKGTLISENDEVLVLRDVSGIQINFKKNNIDLEKTKLANTAPPAPAPTSHATPEQAGPQKAAPKAVKRPARVLTEKDLEQLRQKYDLGEGLYRARSREETNQNETKGERSEEEWRALAQQLVGSLKQAEDSYNELKQDCEKLKNITVQTHILKNADSGQQLPIADTREEICDRAEDAKGAYENAKKDYDDFMETARQQSVPPGYLRVDDQYQDKLENQQ